MAYNSTSWTTDANTKAGSTGTNTVGGVTLYKQFNLYDLSVAQNTHYPMLLGFQYSSSSITGDNAFGTGTDPATSLDISAKGANWKQFIMCYWYLTDNIYIDEVSILSGCDGAHNLDYHLYSYTFDNNTNIGDLSSGALLAHCSSVIQSGGTSAPTIKQSNMVIDSSSVDSGKVILAFVENTEGTSDITAQMTVKYHLI